VIRTFAVIATLVFAAAAAAEPKADPCAGSANDAAMRTCRKAQFDATERRLRELYGKLHARHTGDEPKLAKLLASAQATWRTFRDAECAVQTYESASGTMGDVYRLACLTEMNAARAKTLQEMVDSP
jgi:uncharacterized protein YecT (DUF1311 family)